MTPNSKRKRKLRKHKLKASEKTPQQIALEKSMDACKSVWDKKIDEGISWFLKRREQIKVSKVAIEEKEEPKNGKESLPPFFRCD